MDRGHGAPLRRLASGAAVTVKFLRHLFAVVLVVAVIVGLGMLWAHVSGGGAGGDLRQAPPQALPRLEHGKGGAISVIPGTAYGPRGFRLTWFDLTNTSNLIRTCEIEALLATVVIMVTAIRRRQRRRRRTAAKVEAATH
jgi:hypothetical protein